MPFENIRYGKIAGAETAYFLRVALRGGSGAHPIVQVIGAVDAALVPSTSSDCDPLGPCMDDGEPQVSAGSGPFAVK